MKPRLLGHDSRGYPNTTLLVSCITLQNTAAFHLRSGRSKGVNSQSLLLSARKQSTAAIPHVLHRPLAHSVLDDSTKGQRADAQVHVRCLIHTCIDVSKVHPDTHRHTRLSSSPGVSQQPLHQQLIASIGQPFWGVCGITDQTVVCVCAQSVAEPNPS